MIAEPQRAFSAGVSSGSAVRAILTNPRYLGHQVAGRQRRKDELLDPTDPAAGTSSRQRWQPTDVWVTLDEPAWPAIVDPELWERVNARITCYALPFRVAPCIDRPQTLQRTSPASR